MNYTVTVTERERQVMLAALKFLTDLFSKTSNVDAKPAEQYNSTSPPSATTVTANIIRTQDGTTTKGYPCLHVMWGEPGEKFRATCFDKKLFAALKSAHAKNQPLKFFVVNRGDYLNIVGVAA